jgi:hypothetical protein
MDAPSTLRWNLLVCLGLLGVFALSTSAAYEPYTFLHGDSSFYATVNRSLLDGHLDQHQHQPMSWYDQHLGWNDEMDAGWSNIALGRNGAYYPKHPLLLPLLGTPFFAVFGYNGLLALNVLLHVAALWLAFRIAVRWCRPEAAALVVLTLAMSPLYTRVAYSYSNDILYTVLAIAGIERFLAGRMRLSGLLFGLALFSKPTSVVLALPMGAWLLWKRDWRAIRDLTVGAAPPVLAFLLLNLWMFGNPLVTPYNRILVRHGGQQTLFDIADKFHRPWRQGLLDIFAAPYEGLLENCPAAFVGLLGLPFLVRASPLMAGTLVASMLGFFWLYVPFEYTYARFFLPWATLLAVPLALGVDRLTVAVERLRELLAILPRKYTLALVMSVLLLAAAVGLGRRHDSHAWHASRAITQAKVERNPGPNAVPCDYFNPAQQKWECATYEPEGWQRWGLALGDQCRFPDQSRGWLWLHPAPNATKRIGWTGLPNGRLVLRYALTPASRSAGLQFRVQAGAETQEITVPDVGVVHELVLAAPAGTLAVEVPRQAGDWRQLCVDGFVE